MRAHELEDRPLKELVADVSRDVGLLVRQEVELAKVEITEKVDRVTKGAVSIGIGAVLAYSGLLALVAGLVLVGIAVGITAWVAAVLSGVLLVVVGYLTIMGGKRKMTSGPPALERTTANAKEPQST